MNVWLIKTGEPLPCDPGNPRLFRTGLLAAHLLKRGHRVTWWSSTFQHSSKRHRFTEDTTLEQADGLKLILLHSPGYRGNISLRRLWDHRVLAGRFRRRAEAEEPPDVIHCAFPTIELSDAATAYGEAHGVPVVLDSRDLWPDIFLDALPKALRWAGRIALAPQFHQTRRAFRRAAAISGHTPPFVEFGLRNAGRPAGPLDIAFPFGYPAETPPPDAVERARAFWRDLGVPPGPGVPVFCFFGAFGAQQALDLATPIEAARRLEQAGVPALFVMCGAGPRLEDCRSRATGLQSVRFPGWIGYPEIWVLMRLSRAGLLPYLPARDFAMSFPNKAIEYLSASLPIVTSLNMGYLREILLKEDCAYFYPGRDPGALANAIRRVIGDPEANAARGRRCGALFATRFSAEAVYTALSEHLEAIAAARPRPIIPNLESAT